MTPVYVGIDLQAATGLHSIIAVVLMTIKSNTCLISFTGILKFKFN